MEMKKDHLTSVCGEAALEKLLDAAIFGCSWEWRICELPDDNNPGITRHSVLLYRNPLVDPYMEETAKLEFDPQKPVESFLESFTRMFNSIFARYTKNENIKSEWRMKSYRILLTDLYETAAELNYQVPGRMIDVGVKVIRTIDTQMWVTDAELEYIREGGCLPGFLVEDLYEVCQRP